MKRERTLVVVSLFATIVLLPAMAYAGTYDKFITVADVQNIVRLTKMTMKEEGVLLRFYRRDGKEILNVRFDDPSAFRTITKDKMRYRPLLPPIGLESASGVPQMPYTIVFLKKKYAVSVTSLIQGPRTLISFPHLQAIARLIDSRIPN
ncbi:MAG: hypothetical protein ACE15E_07360 [Acidobacteriota bacterium]